VSGFFVFLHLKKNIIMNRLKRYTEDEWHLIAGTPSLIGAAMAGAASSGMGTVKELMASVRSVFEGKQMYPDNDVIQAIVDKSKSSEQAKESYTAYRDKTMQRIKDNKITNAVQVKELALSDLQQVIELLNKNEIESHIIEYKHWVLNIAQTVAEAAKEGGFLGFGGTRVSEEETIFLKELSQMLNVDVV